MPRWFTLIALVAALLLSGAQAQAASLSDRLDRALERGLAQTGSPGAQAAVIQEGQVVWTGAAGKARTRPSGPVSNRTMFSYASLSKTLVASLVLDRVESGELALDVPISTYIGDAVPGAGQVTVRMLLSHTAGYPDIYSSPEVGPLFGGMYDPNRKWDFPTVLAGFHAPRDPGQTWRYSNAGFILLAYLLDQVEGGSVSDAFQAFAAPAGVTEGSLTMDRTARAARRFAHGYEAGYGDIFFGAKGIPTDLYGLPWGDGLFAGTALGMARFLDGLLVREVLLEPDTLTTMTTETPQSDSRGQGYGFGIYTFPAAGRTWLGHDGSYGGFTSYGFSDVDDGVTIVVVANGEGRRDRFSPADPIWRRLAGAYAPAAP
jgi:CubicO group peptidase (beta-lactamase class C family)